MSDSDWVDDQQDNESQWIDDQPSQEIGLGERVARGALKTLPAIGSIGGGILGAAAGGVSGSIIPFAGTAAGATTGGVTGAGLGAAAGESLKNLIEQYALGDEKTREQIYTGPIKEGLIGASAEIGGQLLTKVPGVVKSGFESGKNILSNKMGTNISHSPIANAEAIENAAKAIGINPPKSLTSSNPLYQDFESGLSQSGSWPARETRKQYDDLWQGLDKAGQKIANLRTPESEFAIGSNIQKDLSSQIEKARAPVSEMYESIMPSLKKVPVDAKVVNRVFGDLKRNPLFQTKDGIELLEEFKGIAASQPELASLKEWRTTIGESLGPSASPLEAKRINALMEAVTKIRDNSINATKASFPKGMHSEVDNLIDQITLADKAHSSNINDLNSIRSIVGNKEVGSPTTFLNKLGDMREGDVAQKASNLDITSITNMKNKFPSIFEKARTAKINDMIASSTNPIGGFNDARFFKQYEGMDRELRDLIFTPEIRSHIENLKTVRQAIPDQLGPSGTPKGIMTMDLFNPKRNLQDFGIKKLLENAGKPSPPVVPQVNSNVLSMNRMRPLSQSVPGMIENQFSTQMPRAAEKPQEEVKKAPDKNQIFEKIKGTKYSQVLQNAAEKGEDSFNAAHFVLSQRDPDYRKTIEDGGQ